MTIALLRSIVKMGKYDKDDAILSYSRFVNEKSRMGYGNNTRILFKNKTLNGMKKTYNSYIAGDLTDGKKQLPKLKEIQSNGTLMRATGLVFVKDKHIKTDCYLSNPNKTNLECNIIYVTLLKMLCNNETVDEYMEEVLNTSENSQITDIIVEAANQESRNVDTKQKGWLLHAFYCAIYALYSQEDSYYKIIDEIILMGGDKFYVLT